MWTTMPAAAFSAALIHLQRMLVVLFRMWVVLFHAYHMLDVCGQQLFGSLCAAADRCTSEVVVPLGLMSS